MEVQTVPETILDKLAIKDSSNPSISTTPIPAPTIDAFFSSSTNLTTTVLNAKVLSFSDEWFASAINLLTPTPAIRKPGYYVPTGAWYDGWETRRHNRKEFDWVVIELGVVGTIDGVEVDTAHFNGNEAPAAGLEGCYLPNRDEASGVEKEDFAGWQEILPKRECGPSQRQAWRLSGPGVKGKEFTHLRLKMFPDGGIARLRVYGSVVPAPLSPAIAGDVTADRPTEDLIAALNGGVAIQCSDQHFGVKSNLILPGRGIDMGDGWETARSRTKGHVDWVIFRMGMKGRSIEQVVVDTKDFRGNFPRAVKVEGWKVESAKAAFGLEDEPSVDAPGWVEVVKGESECAAHQEHIFEAGSGLVDGLSLQGEVWTHIKMTIIPDGGVKRIRVYGKRA